MDLPGEDTAGARPPGTGGPFTLPTAEAHPPETETAPSAPPPSQALTALNWIRKGLGYSGVAAWWGFVLVVFGWPLTMLPFSRWGIGSTLPGFLCLPLAAGLAGVAVFGLAYLLVLFFGFTRYSLRTMMLFILAGGTCVSLIVAEGSQIGALGVTLLLLLLLFLVALISLNDPLIRPRRPEAPPPPAGAEPPVAQGQEGEAGPRHE